MTKDRSARYLRGQFVRLGNDIEGGVAVEAHVAFQKRVEGGESKERAHQTSPAFANRVSTAWPIRSERPTITNARPVLSLPHLTSPRYPDLSIPFVHPHRPPSLPSHPPLLSIYSPSCTHRRILPHCHPPHIHPFTSHLPLLLLTPSASAPSSAFASPFTITPIRGTASSIATVESLAAFF